MNDPTDPCTAPPPATPRSVANRPGLAALARRVGVQADFRRSMLEQIGARLPRLAVRDDDDASIGLMDAWAGALDVLAFYQERIADEGYLGTAKERRSVLELARSIGYELNPGVAASTPLAFVIEAAPGASPVTQVARGQRVQSLPRQDELPQTFETVEAIEARVAYNLLRPPLVRPQRLDRRSTSAWLAGVATSLKPGDRLLFVGPNRERFGGSEQWDERTVLAVEPDPAAGRTRVRWKEALGHSMPLVDPAAPPRAYVLRKRAALFGHNAPDWRMLPAAAKREFYSLGETVPLPPNWRHFEIGTVALNRIDLDAVYTDIVEGSWVLLDKPTYSELYRVVRAETDARTDFTLASKVTQLTFDSREHLNRFPLRETVVHAVSEPLPLADEPVADPVWGDRITVALDPALADGLRPGRRVVVRGKPLAALLVAPRRRWRRQGRSQVVEEVEPPLVLRALAGPATRTLADGERLTIGAPPERRPDGHTRWTLTTAGGFSGTLDADSDDLLPEQDTPLPTVSTLADLAAWAAEAHEIEKVEPAAGAEGCVTITLARALAGVYQRASVAIHANVALATHGETQPPVGGSTLAGLTGPQLAVGSGDASLPMQAFVLPHKPITYTSSAEEALGAASSVSVRVNGLAWTQVPMLYGQAADARVYSVRHADDGTAVLQFGDGVYGARLPSGRDNVTATYRTGIGGVGEVKAGQLSMLMSRPLGLKEAINPLPALGAADPETLDGARANAPLTVLTLDRIVSVQDFEDAARAFAGIGKALADVLWNGERRFVHLSVAGTGPDPLPADAEVLRNLAVAVDGMRQADQEVRITPCEALAFALEVEVVVIEGHLAAVVLDACRGALESAFSFTARALGAGVAVSDVLALLQAVDGVAGAVVLRFDGRDPLLHPRLAAPRARWDAAGQRVLPARLLTLDVTRLDLRERR
jgi:hypothetical protein